MEAEINVLIIEDDFRIAGIHQEITENITGFIVDKSVKSSEEALKFLKECERLPQVILLDIFIPDTEGLSLFHSLRQSYPTVDIIIISAANDDNTILETKRFGAFDYIIKPVDHTRLKEALYRYQDYVKLIQYKRSFTQKDVDEIFGSSSVDGGKEASPAQRLPKGVDPLTLQEIINFLEDDAYEPMTSTKISKSLGMSRSTVRRYMEYLVTINKVDAALNYGNVGRPLRQYIYRKQNEQNDSKKQ
ncbi:response regulator [Virgibacillus oceani]